jgi:eukaryotic-like serine/threonine-protein kinase
MSFVPDRSLLSHIDDTDATALLEGAMTDGDASIVRAHVDDCMTCRELVTAVDTISQQRRAVPPATLRDWLDHPRSWQQVLAMFVQAARALHAAHDAGIVHGDFKPDNVLIAPGGRSLADIGFARASGATLAYMAPELVAGARPDATSDQYAFGVSLYEAFTGRPPFRGTTLAEIRDQQRRWFPRQPERVPKEVSRILLRCLARDRSLRFTSMAIVAETLEAIPRRRRLETLVAAGIVTAAIATAVVLVSGIVSG